MRAIQVRTHESSQLPGCDVEWGEAGGGATPRRFFHPTRNRRSASALSSLSMSSWRSHTHAFRPEGSRFGLRLQMSAFVQGFEQGCATWNMCTHTKSDPLCVGTERDCGSPNQEREWRRRLWREFFAPASPKRHYHQHVRISIMIIIMHLHFRTRSERDEDSVGGRGCRRRISISVMPGEPTSGVWSVHLAVYAPAMQCPVLTL
eukprot:2938818-Rhodomonas_salina.2